MQLYSMFLPGSPIRGYHSVSHAKEGDVYPGLQRTRSLGSSSEDSKRNFAPSSPPPITFESDESSTEYLAMLLKEQKQLAMFPKMFTQAERLLESEIIRVREAQFQPSNDNITGSFDLELPEPDGAIVTITEKLYVPVRQFPEYNFVGRILGPRGMTAKQLEQETGCRIMVRGKGSMKDKRKEESHRGRPNWEHLEDDLHVLIQCEDTENRCRVKLAGAMQHVSRLLVPAPDGTDELKRKQLMELAIINGTYRPYHRASAGSPKSPHSPMLPLFTSSSTFAPLF